MGSFGDFQRICEIVQSYPWCNLFYRQLQRASNDALIEPSELIGLPRCSVLWRHNFGGLNLATSVACALSLFVVLWLSFRSMRRKEALGRVEFSTFLVLYYCSCGLKFMTTGRFLMQGSKGLVVLTALHLGVVVALFGALLVNAFLSLRIVDDAETSAIVKLCFFIFIGICLGVGIYLSYDTAEGLTQAIGGLSNPPESLHSVPLFVITTIWPVVCALGYLVTMLYVVRHILGETLPFWYFLVAAVLFVVSQVVWIVSGQALCNISDWEMDGSFPATILETASVIAIYRAWVLITED